MENKYTLETVTTELLKQGLIRNREQPRRLYHDWPEPEVDVRELKREVQELRRIIHLSANSGGQT